jgi:hypothetical protein
VDVVEGSGAKAPNEFDFDLGPKLGTIRGRVDPPVIYKVEEQTRKSFMLLAQQAATQAMSFGDTITVIRLLVEPVMQTATPSRAELEEAALQVGLGNLIGSLYDTFVYVLTGPDKG